MTSHAKKKPNCVPRDGKRSSSIKVFSRNKNKDTWAPTLAKCCGERRLGYLHLDYYFFVFLYRMHISQQSWLLIRGRRVPVVTNRRSKGHLKQLDCYSFLPLLLLSIAGDNCTPTSRFSTARYKRRHRCEPCFINPSDYQPHFVVAD